MKNNHDSNILAIETSTEACSVALSCRGEIDQRFKLAPRQHHHLILPMMNDLLASCHLQLNDLDALAFGCGPGSFTGLRIAAGVVQGLSLASDLPVLPVSSLQAMAQQCYQQHDCQRVAVAIDAQMSQAYIGKYILNQIVMEKICDDALIDVGALSSLETANCFLAGAAWQGVEKVAESSLGTQFDCLPSAANVVQLAVEQFTRGNYCQASELMPNYLRQEDAWKPWHQQKGKRDSG